MITLLLCVSSFTLGIVSTLLALLYATSPKRSTDAKETIKTIELIGSVKYRYTKVTEITEKQLALISSTERPSAGAAHSKHKNKIMGEIQALEQEKMSIFKSILADGLDPKLPVMIDGQSQEMKMSEVVAMYDKSAPPPPPTTLKPKTEPKSPHRNGLTLIHSKEKIDEPGNPTLP